ncbi:hypothetical protein P4O66_012158, partial [Electrophorus voltai]
AQSATMLCSLLTALLIAMNNILEVESAPYAMPLPFFHIPLDHGGLTILVCVFNDIINRDGGISWITSGASESGPTVYNIAGQGDNSQNVYDPTSIQYLLSAEWNTYTCFVSHRSNAQFIHRHYAGLVMKETDDEDMEDMCSERQTSLINDIQVHTDLLLIQVVRIIFLKITAFNVLMTAQAVIKCIYK